MYQTQNDMIKAIESLAFQSLDINGLSNPYYVSAVLHVVTVIWKTTLA